MRKAPAFLLMLTTVLSLLSLAGCRKKGKEEGPMYEQAEETEDYGYQIYVSPDGNDKNDGSIESPLATPEGARDLLNTKQPEKSTVWLRGGTYPMTDTFVYAASDCANVAFCAYPGEEVIFSGGVCLTGTWTGTAEVNGKTAWVKKFDDIKAFGEFNTLFSEGEFLINARYPNDTEYLLAAGGDAAQNPDNANFAHNKGLVAKDGDLPDLSGEDMSHAYLHVFHYWTDDLRPIASFNAAKNTINLKEATNNTVKANDPYYIENVRCGLTEPGEWYFDYRELTLYYLPRKGETQNETLIYAGQNRQLMTIYKAENLSFHGIKFAYSNWIYEEDLPQSAKGTAPCIMVRRSTGVSFEDCVFNCISHSCISFGNYRDTNDGCSVLRCKFEQIGMHAVVIGGEKTKAVNNTTVSDCLIAHYGQVRHHAVAILQTFGAGSRITHNEIHDGMYTAVSVGWVWGYAESACRNNLIADNLIYNIGHGPLSDMGGIYTLGVQPDSVISGNVIHDVKTGELATTYGGWGIYLDEGSTGFTVKENLVYGCGSQGFHQHYGRDNQVVNNIFALNEEGQVRCSKYVSGDTQIYLKNNILVGDDQFMYHQLSKNCFVDDKNVYYDYTRGDNVKVRKSDGSVVNKAGMTAFGYGKNGVFEDPGFLDAENGNFTLTGTTVTDKIGFAVFDYSKAGSPTFGSTYLINALPRQMDSYKASLVRVYNSAKTKAIANRNEQTIAALKEAYEALNK